ERLKALLAELNLLFADLAFPGQRLPFRLAPEDPPVLSIGRSASVRIDAQTGMYIFADDGTDTTAILMTASEARVIDFLLSHLARGEFPLAPQAEFELVERLVGRPVSDIERALILATLRRCSGNRTHAA